MTVLSPSVHSVVIAGDLNVDLLSGNGHSTACTNLLADFYLTQHVVGPSHMTATSSTLIDHIVSSSQVPVLRSIQTCGLSDHNMQIVNLDYSVSGTAPKVQYVRSFWKCQWDELKSVLRSVPWDTMYSFDDIDDQWAFFHTILEESLNYFLPLWKVYSRKSKRPTPWFS